MRSPSTLAAVAVAALLFFAAGAARAQQTAPEPVVEPPPSVPSPSAPAPSPTTPPVDTTAPLVPVASAASDARVKELEARVAADDERFKADEARIKKLEDQGGGIFKNLAIQGYAQVQFLAQTFDAAASPNLQGGRLPEGISANDVVAKDNGLTTNGTYFRLRRTRIRLKYELDFLRVFIQIDPLPAGGPSAPQGTIARNAEATGIARWTKDVRTEFGAGLFEVPMRFELLESSMYRPFIERSWLSQNMFPTERDLGFHAKTLAFEDRLQIELGVLNGQRLGEPRFVELPDFNRSKDYFLRAYYKIGPVALAGFGYYGRGSVVDSKNLRVKNFPRWGANVGVTYADTLFKSLGETRAYAELMFGMNMDTGVRYAFALPAIPTNLTDDVKNLYERGLYVRAEQDFGKNVFAGFRYDMYTPDSDVKNNARDTYTLMAGVKFTKLLRIINEWQAAVDNVHQTAAAAPSKHIYSCSLWMQGSFY